MLKVTLWQRRINDFRQGFEEAIRPLLEGFYDSFKFARTRKIIGHPVSAHRHLI